MVTLSILLSGLGKSAHHFRQARDKFCRSPPPGCIPDTLSAFTFIRLGFRLALLEDDFRLRGPRPAREWKTLVLPLR